MQNRFPELVAAQPELLAHHYTEAGLPSDAIPWWQRAGESAIRRSANAEAINHLNRALALLGSLPDSPERRQQEIALQLTLGVPWLGQKGWGAEEVKRIYARARELCESLGQRPELAGALIGLYSFYYVRQELDTAIDLARQVLQLVENVGDPGLVIEGHWGVGLVSFSRAEFEVSRAHLEQVRTLYDPARHAGLAYVFGLDPGVTGIAYHGHTLWALGYPDAALRSAREAVELAEGVRHPLSSTLALWFAAVIHQLRGEVEEVVRVAGRALALATEQQFPIWIGCSSFLLGWAHCRVGRPDDGLRSMLEGEAIRMATGAMIYRTYFLKLLAEEYLAVGDLEAARASLAEGFDEMERSSERWCAAELHRLSGELRLRESATAVDEAESLFREAYSVARAQGAKQWALRASMGLGRLWRARGDTNSARESVGETYKTFTEGFTTADLGEARTFL